MQEETKELTVAAPQIPAVGSEAAVMDIITKAIEKGVPVETLDKIMNLQERVLNRNARMSFASALSAMQSEMPSIAENGAIKVGNETRSKYATFEDINDAVKPILQRHGFAMSFRIKQDANIEITAILSHRDGHSEETSMHLPSDTSGSKNAVQALGSTVSYGKRYTMMALLNITSRAPGDKDDDGEGSEAITTEQAVEIDRLIAQVGAKKDKFLSVMGVGDVRNIRSRDFGKAKTTLEEVRRAREQRKKGEVA